MSIDPTSITLPIGENVILTTKVLPYKPLDQKITWTSSNADVASVDNGFVSALSGGEAMITASLGDFSATCTVTVPATFSYGGMCLESVTGGSITFWNPNRFTIEYKVENRGWVTANSKEITLQVDAKKRVWFRGKNKSYSRIYNDGSVERSGFNCQGGDFYLYGNLMSLIYGDDYESKTEITCEYAFSQLFSENPHLLNHPTLDIELPATTLSKACYRNMFYYCTGLTRAPKLPAKKLEEYCYTAMFSFCTSLKEMPEMAAEEMAHGSCMWMMYGDVNITEVPELPATKLAKACYQGMFIECSNLKKGPSILPATELANDCYSGMFAGCEKLEEAPELPALEVKSMCYTEMFYGCKSLKKAPELPATKMENSCYARMFQNCDLTEAPELPAMDLEYACCRSMFEGNTRLEKAPVLPAPAIHYYSYEKMFFGCTSLKYIKMLATKKMVHAWEGYVQQDFLPSDDLKNYCKSWVEGVSPSGTFVMDSEAQWEVRGVNGVPDGWTIEVESH